MSGNKMALDALTAITDFAESLICTHENTHRGGVLWVICDDCGAKWEGGKPKFETPKQITTARAAIAALQAEPQPDEADLRQLMGMNEAEIDAELISAGISPDDAVKRADRAIKGALATVRAERRLDVIYADARALKGQP